MEELQELDVWVHLLLFVTILSAFKSKGCQRELEIGFLNLTLVSSLLGNIRQPSRDFIKRLRLFKPKSESR